MNKYEDIALKVPIEANELFNKTSTCYFCTKKVDNFKKHIEVDGCPDAVFCLHHGMFVQTELVTLHCTFCYEESQGPKGVQAHF